eukprot:322835-Hanusia_phi.AAC.1
MGSLPGREENELAYELRRIVDDIIEENATAGREETKLILPVRRKTRGGAEVKEGKRKEEVDKDEASRKHGR